VRGGPVAGLVGINGGVVSGVTNLESRGVRAQSLGNIRFAVSNAARPIIRLMGPGRTGYRNVARTWRPSESGKFDGRLCVQKITVTLFSLAVDPNEDFSRTCVGG
jgi:hypothetical protein